MIEMLRQVIEQVEQLGPDEQGIVAEQLQRVLEELEQERGWKERLHDPTALPTLERLIEQALAEDDTGETVDMDLAIA